MFPSKPKNISYESLFRENNLCTSIVHTTVWNMRCVLTSLRMHATTPFPVTARSLHRPLQAVITSQRFANTFLMCATVKGVADDWQWQNTLRISSSKSTTQFSLRADSEHCASKNEHASICALQCLPLQGIISESDIGGAP